MEISGDKTIDPAQWGPAFWHTMHYAAAIYPETPTEADQEIAKLFVETHGAMLPCPECRGHFSKLRDTNPPAVGSSKEFRQWVVDAHNQVNKRTDSNPEVWTLEKADHVYLGTPAPTQKAKPKNLDAQRLALRRKHEQFNRQQQISMGRVQPSSRSVRQFNSRTLRNSAHRIQTRGVPTVNRKAITTQVVKELSVPKKKKKGCGCNKKR